MLNWAFQASRALGREIIFGRLSWWMPPFTSSPYVEVKGEYINTWQQTANGRKYPAGGLVGSGEL